MANKKVASAPVVGCIISEPNIETAVFKIRGTAPYVQHKFSQKSKLKMLQAQTSTAATKAKKEPRDLEEDYQGAFHLTKKGKMGIPCPAFRSAMISACRVAGFQMTKAKLSFFIVADDYDADDGTGMTLFASGEPEMHQCHVRLESGVASIAVRPMWRAWTAAVKIRWDADQFSHTDIGNLLSRAGLQVGIGEGRPDSKKSHGMGWGTFELY